MSDPVRIRHVLLHLVGNAPKFTHDGSVQAIARSEPTPDGAHRLQIDITDTGIGMNAELLALVQSCAPFVQADSTDTRRFGGTGLGLSISQSLAELMGGGLSIASSERCGPTCTFVCIVQQADETECPEVTATPVGRTQLLQGVHVLVVDDATDLRRLLKHRLEQAGATVYEATSGPSAIALMQSDRTPQIDILLLDMQMPTMD